MRISDWSSDVCSSDLAPMTALELVDVHHGYRLRGRIVPAVDGVSLSVARGEIVGLIGESGSGKTTLARLATCLLDCDRGEVRFDGQRVSNLPERQRKRSEEHTSELQSLMRNSYAVF